MKPDNFVMGKTKTDELICYIIDYGLAKRFVDRKTGLHIPFK